MEPNATPTAPSAPAPPTVGAPLVEYIRTQRQNAGTLLAILSVLFLALTIFLALKAFRAQPAADKPADQQLPDNLRDTKQLPPVKAPGDATDSKRTDYMFGWLATLAAFLSVGGVAAWMLAAPPAADETRQKTEARVAILTLGASLGAMAILFGMVFFYQWRESLTNWLDKGQTKDAKWVLTPILMIVVGAGLIFLAIQPARADERNNAPIRRTVYWTNFGLTALLLLVAFVVANVLFSLKVPNKLDTTATGFYSLSDNTKNLFGRLNEPVTAYAIGVEGSERMSNDIRQLLLACQDVSEGKFRVKFINDVANKSELINLIQQYPQLDLALNQRGRFDDEDESPGAVLLTTGEDEKRHSVIPNREFSTVEGRQVLFQGEARLFKEIAFLADSQTKQIVYFTQGNRELDINGGQEVAPARSGARLKAYLEKNYLDVRSLTLPAEKPTIPDDAAVVVVADPESTVPEAAVGALRAYMNNPAKKGKLVVLVGAHAGPDNKMTKTGLEPLLAELNVQIGTKFVYNLPNQYVPRVDQVIAGFSRAAEQNPILQAIVKVSPFLRFGNPREVEVLTANQNYQATPLMYTAAEMRTWLEEDQILDVRAIVEPMLQSVAEQRKRGVSGTPRSLAVTVSEKGTARAVVFGNSFFVSDDSVRQSRSATAPLSFDLLGVSIDWLRDKPSIAVAGIESKKYTEYRFPQPAGVDTMRILYLPLGLAFLTVLGLGAGVWVIRRR